MRFLFLILLLCACDSRDVRDAKEEIKKDYEALKHQGEEVVDTLKEGKKVAKEEFENLKKEAGTAKEELNKTFGKDIEEAKSLFKKK